MKKQEITIVALLLLLIFAAGNIVILWEKNEAFKKEVTKNKHDTFLLLKEKDSTIDSLQWEIVKLNLEVADTAYIYDTVFIQCPGGWHLHTKGVVQREFILTRKECE